MARYGIKSIIRSFYDAVSLTQGILCSSLFILCVINIFTPGPLLVNAISSSTHSVVNKGDLLLLNKMTSSINVGDIISVRDPSRDPSYYVQRVTDVNRASLRDKKVQIQYQPENSENLERRWFIMSDIVGKVAFRIPYLGLLLQYQVILFVIGLLWFTRPWEYIGGLLQVQ